MKTNVCELTGAPGEMKTILTEVEKCAEYDGLTGKPAMHLRLIAEELVAMLPQLMDHANGKFWLKSDKGEYRFHVVVEARTLDFDEKEKILSLSTSGKNAANAGIMGKIRMITDMMLFSDDATAPIPYVFTGMPEYDAAWSLLNYRLAVEDEKESKPEEWDELESSIIAKLADDVVIGIRARKVDITVRKRFE